MSLSPSDVNGVEFRQPSPGARGYHEAEVDTFLDDVAVEMRRLAEENETLAQQLQRDDLAGHLRRLERDRDRAEDHARAVLAELEQARAEAEQAQARPAGLEFTWNSGRSGELEIAWTAGRAGFPGQGMPDDSLAPNPHIFDLARRTAEEHLAEAHRESATILRKAATEAARVVSDAELRASTIIADARHAHAEAIAGLDAKRAEAMDLIDVLKDRARRWRTAISDDVDLRLRGMDGGAPAISRPRGAP
ncbi:DivIVA domain-containing protein [Actinoplanes couchii]|uniref:DivIVA domain-containing protein n=1 Tax=Actinoplanes couchii TaxID=403638 RepID=UPI001EF1CF49|nr:DivIVA domain-containing protein [Actinoplanes couchii]MDR6320741.1 DivIVA domain-containing protein [Actinoplanes couchii]